MTSVFALPCTKNIAAGAAGLLLALSCFLAAAPSAHAAALTGSQIDAILNLLSSFGANSSVISNVSSVLRGESGTTGSKQIRVTVSSKSYDTENPKISGTASGVSSVFFDIVDGGYLAYRSDEVRVSSGRWSSKVEEDLDEGEYAVYVYTLDNVERARGTIEITNLEDENNVSFSASPTSGAVPLEVYFEGSGSVLRQSAYIDFGDGAKTREGGVNASHVYLDAGTYTATLHKDGAKGEVVARKTITVSGSSKSATLSATPASGAAPLEVEFKGSVAAAGSYALEFGDGSSQSLSFAQGRCSDGTNYGICDLSLDGLRHTYAQAGTYTARLKERLSGQTLASRVISVAVGTEAAASVSASPLSGTAPLTVTFSLSGANSQNYYTINFGDNSAGAFSIYGSSGSVSHTYYSAGTYAAVITERTQCSWWECTGPSRNVATKTVVVSAASASPTGGKGDKSVMNSGSSLMAAAAMVPLSLSADSLNIVADQINEVNYALADVLSAYIGLFSYDAPQAAAAAVPAMPGAAGGESLAATLAYLPESLYETAGKTTDFLAAVEMAPLYVITDALSDALFKAGIY